MVNNSSCIEFGCSKRGTWSKRTVNVQDNEVAEESSLREERRSFYRFPAINPKAGIKKQKLQKHRRER